MSSVIENKTIIITGGAGFIGSHVVRLMVKKYPNYHIVNLDALTYAGNLENLRDIENEVNYTFEKADITRPEQIDDVFKRHQPDGIIHLAAESHVDRSIEDPLAFVNTNVLGTIHLLNACRKFWGAHMDGFCGCGSMKTASNPCFQTKPAILPWALFCS